MKLPNFPKYEHSLIDFESKTVDQALIRYHGVSVQKSQSGFTEFVFHYRVICEGSLLRIHLTYSPIEEEDEIMSEDGVIWSEIQILVQESFFSAKQTSKMVYEAMLMHDDSKHNLGVVRVV